MTYSFRKLTDWIRVVFSTISIIITINCSSSSTLHYHHDSLQEIVIPANVRLIDDEVFYGCESLIRVVFTPRTASIELGREMFRDCFKLRFVTLPHNLQSIPAEFFFSLYLVDTSSNPCDYYGDWNRCLV